MASKIRRNSKRKCTISSVSEIKRVRRDEDNATPLPEPRVSTRHSTARDAVDVPLLEHSASDNTKGANASGVDISSSVSTSATLGGVDISSSVSTSATLGSSSVSTSAPYDDRPSHMLSEFRAMVSAHVASHPECGESAPTMSKYLRNQFAFLGLKAPVRRTLQKGFLEKHGTALQDRHTMIGFVKALWDQDEREFQAFGADMLAQYREVLLGTTGQEFQEAMAVCEHCVVTKSWWDTVDAISYPG